MNNTDPEQRVEQYLKQAGEKIVQHMEVLNKKVLDLSSQVWSTIQAEILEMNPETELSDANYIMTGVCVHILAHHNAYCGTPEFARETALENFNTWYKIAIEASIKEAEKNAPKK